MIQLNTSAQRAQDPTSTDLHYVEITNALIDFDLAPRQFQLAVTLLSYRWFATSPIIPSVVTLASRMRCSVRTVQYAMRGLVAKRLIEVQYCYRPDGGQMSNLYVIGPALTPLLAPAHPKPGTASHGEFHPPVQPPAHKQSERKILNGKEGSQPRGRPARSIDDFYRGGLIPRR